MKIEIKKYKLWSWCYNINELTLEQKKYDYMFKHLDFDKLDKDNFIFFKNKETEKWFHNKYIYERLLENIYKDSPLGYEWLKENWGNGVFVILVYYQDKRELKTIVNKFINIELKRGYI